MHITGGDGGSDDSSSGIGGKGQSWVIIGKSVVYACKSHYIVNSIVCLNY